WLTPHGFLKGAAAHATTLKVAGSRGRKVVSFTAFGKYTVTGTIDDQNLVERVETRMDVSFTGDTLFEGIYSNYKEFGGADVPRQTDQVSRQHAPPLRSCGRHPRLRRGRDSDHHARVAHALLRAADLPEPAHAEPRSAREDAASADPRAGQGQARADRWDHDTGTASPAREAAQRRAADRVHAARETADSG